LIRKKYFIKNKIIGDNLSAKLQFIVDYTILIKKLFTMNLIIKNVFFFLTATLLFSLSVAFTPAKTTVEMGGNSCTVYVTTSSGAPARSVKVSTEVSGGISCVGGRSFYTDSDGEVTLEWVSGCKLRKIYVDGSGYDVDYTDGNNYSIKMR